MSRFVQCGQALTALLEETVACRHSLRGLLLVDSTGLPLASTIASSSLEERAAALASIGAGFVTRARADLEMGAPHLLRLASRDRQLVLVPVDAEVWLIALADAEGSAADIDSLLLALTRDLLAALGGNAGFAPLEGAQS